MFPFQKRHPPKEYLDFIKLIKNNLPQDPFSEMFSGVSNGKTKNYAIRLALAEEQGYLCCYCQQRIPMKPYKLENEEEVEIPNLNIEHYKPKSLYDGKENQDLKHLCDDELKEREDLRVEWTNLLCACLNHEGYCGDQKENYELCFIPNPTLVKDYYHETSIYCNQNGIIKSHNENVNKEISGVIAGKDKRGGDLYEKGKLYLNYQPLVNKRKGAWEAVFSRITKKYGKNLWGKNRAAIVSFARELLNEYSNMHVNVKDRKLKNREINPEDGALKYREYAWFIVMRLKKEFKELR